MELFTIEGLRAEDFTALVCMASDEKHAIAVRQWCKLANANVCFFVDQPDVVIDNAVTNAEFSITYADVQLMVQRIEVLAAARGVLLPRNWQVIY